MELREYQQRSIDQLYDWFRNNQGNPCLNLPTGSGKSIIIASLCQDALTNWPETKIILLTHVKELIEQDTRQILNVWPDAPVGIYSASVGVKKLGYPITVAGIQSIRHKAKSVGHIDLCIVDECFIAGTLIKTPHGDIPIERLRPGDKVFNALGVGKIEAISQKETTNLIRLEFDDGTITSCTENHPFFTSNGWKKAGELENGTHILSFKEMRILWKSFYSVDKKRRGRGIYLRNARKTLGKTKILFNFLCEKSRKPHERQTKQREDETNTSANTAQAHSKGRKWETASIASACAASCTWGRLGCGICCEHRGQEQVSPLCLQNRHSKSCAKNSDRGRRTVTQHNGAKGAGHKENKPFNFVRVVSVSRVKCESPCAVFNLQVSGHPSYFADEHLVHNCHLISHKAEGSYRTFIDDLRAINPNLRVIGLTATPYRLGHGLITDKPAIFDDILEPTSIEELLAHGYLAPLRSKRPDNLLSTDGVAKRGGEFIEAELQKAVNKKDQNLRVACEIIKYAEERKAWLIFCTGVKHAHAMAEILQGLDIPTACITGDTPKNEREEIIDAFKLGSLRAVTNADILITGFDYPDIDLIAMCRPTLSPGLYMQTVGRGMRIAPDKTDCLVLDFAGNVKRHGPITAVRPPDRKGQGHGEAPVKVCEQCQEFVTLSTRVCPVCGWEFPAPEVKPLRLHNDDIMGNGKTMRVKSWLWRVYTSNSGKEMVTITYFSADNLAEMVTEYLCLLHGGYAQDKAQRLLHGIAKRAGAVIENPYDLEGIVSTMNTVPAPVEITKERDGKYYRVTGRVWNHAA